MGPLVAGVTHRPLLVVLASVFVGMSMVLTIAAAVTGTPLVLMAAIPIGLTGGLMWYQGTGRFLARMLSSGGGRRRHTGHRTSRGGRARTTAAGRAHTRDDGRQSWEASLGEEARRAARTRARRQAQRRARRRERGTGGGAGDGAGGTAGGANAGGGWRNHHPSADRLDDLTAAEAYDVLGLDPTATEDEVRDAYRERAKTAHPDTDGGSAEAFQELNEAYERLVED